MRWLGLISVLALAGCWNFQEDVRFCRGDGGCRPSELPDSGSGGGGGAATGGGGGSGGGGGAVGGGGGSGDAGSLFPDGGPGPLFFSGAGWGWEYPWPAGPGLRSVVALSDDEAWAIGDGDLAVHLLGGTVQFVQLPRVSDWTSSDQRVIRAADGGVLFVAGGKTLQLRADGGWLQRTLPFTASAAVRASQDVAWFGGQWQGGSGGCAVRGLAVVDESAGPGATCLLGNGADVWMVGFDPAGWALDSDGDVWRRLDAGAWSLRGTVDGGFYTRGAVLALSAQETLVVGAGRESPRLMLPDGGTESVSFDPQGRLPIWTALEWAPGASVTEFLLVGKPGVQRCPVSVPFDGANCVPEYDDATESLEAVSVSARAAFAVGDDGQLVVRDQAGTWRAAWDGGAGRVNDVWGNSATGELWAVTDRGVLLERRADGWTRHQVRPTDEPLQTLVRLSDGLWVFSARGIFQWDGANAVPVGAFQSDGQPLPISGSGIDFVQAEGTAPGKAWVASTGGAFHYREDGTWVREASGSCPGTVVSSLWVAPDGTAWMVGGWMQHFVCRWDGTQWVDRTPPPVDGGARGFSGVWGVGPDEVFATLDTNGYHFLPDGGVAPWPHLYTSSLAGGWARDGGYVLFGAAGTWTWRGVKGAMPPGQDEVGAPRYPNGYISRTRVIGNKVFVMGDRDSDRSWLLSLDAGL